MKCDNIFFNPLLRRSISGVHQSEQRQHCSLEKNCFNISSFCGKNDSVQLQLVGKGSAPLRMHKVNMIWVAGVLQKKDTKNKKRKSCLNLWTDSRIQNTRDILGVWIPDSIL